MSRRPCRTLLAGVLVVALAACTGSPATDGGTRSPAVTPTAPDPTALPSPHQDVVFTSGVPYGPDPAQVVDTYVPDPSVASPTGDAHRRPAMVLVHGGGWTTGTRTANHVVAAGLARLGWVAVTVDYRLAPAHPHPAAVDDVRAALQWVHAHADDLDVDPTSVVLGGDSAGGHLSGMVALADDRPPVAAWVAWSGAHDLATLPDRLAGTEHASLVDHIADYLDCDAPGAPACAERATAASPISRVSPDDPPSLLLHSTDELIPLADARAMRDALAAAGVRTELVTFEGRAHGGRLYAPASDAVAAFLGDVLDLQTP